MKKVILDVDTGIDDALALLLAAAHPGLDLLAVSCVGGNVELGQVVTNTVAVLHAAGAGHVPVAAGAARPLIEPAQDASHVHGADGLGGLALPAAPNGAREEHAVELLRRTVLDSDEPVTLVALAPMTNIALLLRTYPAVAGNIERIVFMGGSVGVGNATPAAEFNIWHDPEAAAIVLDSGIPATMYGLEPFYRVTCDAASIARLARSGRTCERIAGGLLDFVAKHADGGDGDGVAIGDAGAVCAVIEPDALVTRDAPVEVALAPGPARGRTIVDLRAGVPAGAQGSSIAVALDVDAARYRRLFLDALATLP